MKATGIVQPVDDLGRIVIPKEIRRTLKIREGDPSQITLKPTDKFLCAVLMLAERIETCYNYENYEGVAYMKPEKIRTKYPTLQTDEEYAKLEKMLTYRKYENIMGIGGPLLLLFCGCLLAYYLRNFWVFLCTGVGMILVRILAERLFAPHIDDVFIAKAGRKTGILTREDVNKTVKYYAKKPETVRLLKVKLKTKTTKETFGGEYDSDPVYYFCFDCGTYGYLEAKITYEDYVCAEENHEYFVLLNVGGWQNSIEGIYSTKEYTLSSELESILEII